MGEGGSVAHLASLLLPLGLCLLFQALLRAPPPVHFIKEKLSENIVGVTLQVHLCLRESSHLILGIRRRPLALLEARPSACSEPGSPHRQEPHSFQ